MLCHGSGSVELTGGRKCTGVFLRAADGFMRVHHFGFLANRSKGQSRHQGKAIRADLNGYPLAILSLTRPQGRVGGTMIQSIAEAAQRLRGLVQPVCVRRTGRHGPSSPLRTGLSPPRRNPGAVKQLDCH
jgi:hypothetical protein